MSTSTHALEATISQQLDTYIGAFNAGDYSTAASNYHEPAVSIGADAVTILPARKDLSNFLSSTVERLRKDGFDHSEWAGPKKVVVLENTPERGLILASCTCKRLRKDGTSCEEFTATYTLRKTDEQGWLIAAIHHHPTETQLK
jgi:ketosteroid isomerase-like protein